MKRSIKGFVILSFSALMVVTILTGAVRLISGDTAFPTQAINVNVSNGVVKEKSDLNFDNLKVNVYSTATHSRREVPITTLMINYDSSTESKSNSMRYLYEKYLEAINSIVSGYCE